MADDGKLTIIGDIDTSEIEKKIKAMQDKIEGMKRSTSGGPIGQLTSGQDQNNLKNQRLEDIRKRENKRERQLILKDLQTQQSELDKHVERYEKIAKLQENMNKKGKAYQKSLEMQRQEFEKMSKLADSINKGRSALYGDGFGPFDGRQSEFIRRGFQGGMRRGIGAIGRTVKNMPMAQKMDILGAGVAATGTAVKGLGEIGFQIGTRDERRTSNEAQVAGMLGEAAQLQMNRRGYEMQYYAPERQRALERAMNRKDYSQMRDATNVGGSLLQNIGGGMVMGGAAGSIIPVLGTTAGTILGGIGGAARYGYNTLTNDTAREGIGSALGSALGFEDSEDFYEKIKSGEAAQVYQDQLEKEKTISFEKRNAQEYFMKNRGRIQALQRGFGMDDQELFLGEDSLFRRGTEAGFITDTIAKNMQAIGSAGGTSQMAQDGAILASQMERGLNLTNAGKLVGRMSGMGMGEEGSKDAIIRMYAEATRLGLDGSEFAKETRTFLETAADMSYQSGASSQSVAGLLGMGTNLLSDRGIKASQDALQNLMGKTGQMGGLTGQYQLAELTSADMNEFLGEGNEFSEAELAMLTGMDITRVSEDDEYLQTLMRRKGIEDPEKQKEFIQRLRKGKGRATLRTPEQEEALKELDQLKRAQESGEMVSPEAMADARSRVRELGVLTEGESEARRDIFSQKSSADLLSGIVSGKITDNKSLEKARDMFNKALGADTGKMTDRAEKAMSFDDKGNLKNLEKYSGQLTKSFIETNDSLIEFRNVMDGLVEAMKAGNAELVKEYEERIKRLNDAANSGGTNLVEQGSTGNENIMDSLNSVFGNFNR